MAKTPAQRAKKHGAAATAPRAAVAKPGTRGAPAKAQKSNAGMLVIASCVASLFLFWYFHLLTLNQMTQLTGGLAMPDSMVFGFNTANIEALGHVMNSDALGQLQFVHKTAGMLFPLVFALSAVSLIAINIAKKWLRRLLWVFPVLFAGFQLWANVAIDDMLGAKMLDAGSVALASFLVVASWSLLVLSLAGAGVALYQGRRKRAAAARDKPAAG